jgi:flagellar biosynthesis repressor protein FlbT
MSGLVLKVAPRERFVVNGAVLENGDRPARFRIDDGRARVLRCRDALPAGDVDTPVKQIYYALQLVITGDLAPEATLAAIDVACAELADVFGRVNPAVIPVLRMMIARGNYYSALCQLRQLIALEAELLGRGRAYTACTA